MRNKAMTYWIHIIISGIIVFTAGIWHTYSWMQLQKYKKDEANKNIHIKADYIEGDKVKVDGDYVEGDKITNVGASKSDIEDIVKQIAQQFKDDLQKQYPKAYGVFGITRDGFVVPKGLIPDTIKIFWDTGKVYNISEDSVEIVFPDIIPYAGMRTSGNRTILPRKVGAKSGPLIATGGVSPVLEIIGIQGALVIVALGIEE